MYEVTVVLLVQHPLDEETEEQIRRTLEVAFDADIIAVEEEEV